MIFYRNILTLMSVSVLLFSALIIPVYAQETDPTGNSYEPESSGLVPCGFDEDGNNIVEGDEECTFADLIRLANRLIDFAIYLSVPIFVLLFVYAGFLYMTAQGNVGKIKEAHGLFIKAIIGFAIILSAWIIVNLIVGALLDEIVEINTFLG